MVNSTVQLRILTRDALYEIHSATLEILERIGVKVDEQKALRMLGDAGAHINDKEKIAKIPQYLVEEAIKKAPSGFVLYGRDPKDKLRFEEKKVYFGMGGGSMHVLDLETGKRRASTLKDAENFFRLSDALENIHQCGYSVVHPGDIPSSAAYLHAMLSGFKNTTKPLEGETGGQLDAMDSIRMASVVAGGEEELKKRPMLLGYHNPVSPLQHSKELTEGLLLYAKHRQPLIVAPEAQAGATAPVTLAGLLAQQNAEILSGIVIAELANPGAPVLYGTVSTIMDMKTGNLSYGAIEAGLINVATAQLAHYYNLPSRGTCGNASKKSDIQAGFEQAMTLMMAAFAGINFIHNAAGCLESTLIASYEQAVIDNEICGMVSRALRGIRTSDETLALDVIEDVGSGGQYLTQQHTLEYLEKEHYIPTIINREKWERWERAGSKDLREVAREKAKTILKEHQPEPLDQNIEEELKKIIREVEERERKRSSSV